MSDYVIQHVDELDDERSADLTIIGLSEQKVFLGGRTMSVLRSSAEKLLSHST